MKNLFCVKGRVIVITGATGILGRAMVRHFAEEGAHVVILGRQGRIFCYFSHNECFRQV